MWYRSVCVNTSGGGLVRSEENDAFESGSYDLEGTSDWLDYYRHLWSFIVLTLDAGSKNDTRFRLDHMCGKGRCYFEVEDESEKNKLHPVGLDA